MTEAQIAEAAKLYRSGLSLVAVGRYLGFNDGTVWLALKKVGVTMRDTHGRD